MKLTHLTLLAISPLLAAAMTSCSQAMADTGQTDSAFEYRDIYLPEYNTKANEALGLNNLDNDWGLWGHNLGAVLPDDASAQAFAKVNGGVNRDQFCFMSNTLFDYIGDYIKSNYLFRDSVKFAILPNDNGVVCLCSECQKIGNTKGDASPAIFHMIDRLAKKYPEHEFYTSHYMTSKQLPKEKMAPNTGVIISAIDYPRTAGENTKEIAFVALLEEWKENTDNIYIWDYINNFDDYLTPSPIFGPMQHRLGLYRDEGVTGVFLNGSGNDFSTFSNLKKAVLARMMENPDLDWAELLRQVAREQYPVAGDDIADFMILQEKMMADSGKALPYYEGLNKARKIYLPEEEFVEFYNKLVHHKNDASPQEREALHDLTGAMAFTMLELKRINGDISNTDKLKERLGAFIAEGHEFYNEGAWGLREYLDSYEYMETEAGEANGNLLRGVKLRQVTELDEDYPDISILTNGLLGIPSNYHNGNLISSADPALKIGIPRQPGMKKLKVWLVYNPGFKIGLPAEVYLSADGRKGKAQVPQKEHSSGHTFLEFDVPQNGDIVLTLVKDPEVKTMAIDEIEAF